MVWDIFSDIGPCFPVAGELCKFYGNAGGKRQIQRKPTPLSAIQAASQFTFISVQLQYTPLVISRNDKKAAVAGAAQEILQSLDELVRG